MKDIPKSESTFLKLCVMGEEMIKRDVVAVIFAPVLEVFDEQRHCEEGGDSAKHVNSNPFRFSSAEHAQPGAPRGKSAALVAVIIVIIVVFSASSVFAAALGGAACATGALAFAFTRGTR